MPATSFSLRLAHKRTTGKESLQNFRLSAASEMTPWRSPKPASSHTVQSSSPPDAGGRDSRLQVSSTVTMCLGPETGCCLLLYSRKRPGLLKQKNWDFSTSSARTLDTSLNCCWKARADIFYLAHKCCIDLHRTGEASISFNKS